MIPNKIISNPNENLSLDAALVGDLLFFEAAARHRSFTAAARELNVTQGAVSQRIRNLERRLDLRLFNRAGRGVMPTVAGENLFSVVTGSIRSMESEVAAMLRERRQVGLVISCAPSLAMEWLLPRLGAWHQISGNAKLQIRAEFHRLNRDIMLNEGVDVAVRYDLESYSDLHVIDLYEERIFPVCSRSYWRDKGEFESLADLDRLDLLHDGYPWAGAEPCTEWQSWLAAQDAGNRDFARGEYFNLAQMAARAALLNQGLAMGRSILVADYIADGRLVRPFGAASAPGGRYRLLTVEPVRGKSIVAQFAQWIREQMRLSAETIARSA